MSPSLPPPDESRAVDQLKCDVSILRNQQAHDVRIKGLLCRKVACLRSEALVAEAAREKESTKVSRHLGARLQLQRPAR